MEHKIIVAGIGPGNPDYIVPAARQAIEEAAVLVGGSRALADFARDGQATMTVRRDIPAVLAFVRDRLKTTDIVVMVSGDPGYFSLLDALRRDFPLECLQVIPGISSVQLAFSRLALPWHGARLLSMHGRMPEKTELAYAPGAMLGILTDAVHNSRTIAQLLLQLGWPAETELFICARLSYADEKIIRTTLHGAGQEAEIGHCILVVKA